MPREIWNEGRVVGESAYEIYVKQHLAEDPNSPPATEKEWLASSLAMGASMVLKVPSVSSVSEPQLTYLDIKLPHNSNLSAANTIVASYFTGSAEFPEFDEEHPDDSMWATKITDYGLLISNNSVGSPDTGYVGPEASYTTGMPAQVAHELDLDKIRDYMHIIDGVVIQPGNWSETTSYPPAKDFKPDLTDTYPRVRLLVRGNINSNPLILLTGFTLNSVLSGCVGTEGSTNTSHPENGDFLGPAEFPWTSKIVFSVPNSFLQYNLGMTYVRTLVDSAEVKDNAIVDMVATDPKDYYADYDSVKWSLYHPVTVPIPGSSDVEIKNPKYPYYVSKVTPPVDAASATLTVFTKPSGPYYPPALWGTRITSAGNTALYPLDVVAPGTIKMFNNIHAGVLQDYQLNFPGTWAMNHTNDNHIQILDDSDPENPQFVTLANQGDTFQSVNALHTTNQDGSQAQGFWAPDETGSATGKDYSQEVDEVPKGITITTSTSSNLYLSIGNTDSQGNLTQLEINRDPSIRTDSPHPSIVLTHANTHDDITWSALLAGLQNNRGIDLLGNKLKQLKYSLTKPVTNINQAEIDTDAYDSSVGRAYISFGSSTQNKLYLGYNLPYTSNASECDYAIVNNTTDHNIPYVLKLVGGERRWHFANQYRIYTASISGSGDPDELLYNCRDVFMRHGILIIHRSDVPGDQTSQYTKAHLVALIDRWAGACTLHSLSENPSISNPNDCGGKLIIRAHYTGSVSDNNSRTAYIQILNRCESTAFDIIAIGYFGDPYDSVHTAYTSDEPIYQQPVSVEYLESPT